MTVLLEFESKEICMFFSLKFVLNFYVENIPNRMQENVLNEDICIHADCFYSSRLGRYYSDHLVRGEGVGNWFSFHQFNDV